MMKWARERKRGTYFDCYKGYRFFVVGPWLRFCRTMFHVEKWDRRRCSYLGETLIDHAPMPIRPPADYDRCQIKPYNGEWLCRHRKIFQIWCNAVQKSLVWGEKEQPDGTHMYVMCKHIKPYKRQFVLI